ncbi:hypothetical protein ACLB2K_056200 [Fragaria x ananassa]
MSQHELETNGSSFLREMPPRDSGADLYHVNSQRNKEEMDSKLDPLIAFRTLLTGHHHKETLVSCSQHHHSGQLTLKELASSTEMVDMSALKQMGDKDLKELGIPMTLLAPLHRTSRLLLFGVAIPGLAVPLKQHLLALLLAVVASGLYGGGAYLTNYHFPAVVIGFGTIMGLVRSVDYGL